MASHRNTQPNNIRSIMGNFNALGDFVAASSYGNGHINDTYKITCDQGAARINYILQRINHNVFKNATGVMQNVSRICHHSAKRLRENGVFDTTRRTLTLVPTITNKDWFVDQEGNYWRCFIFIERAHAYEIIENTAQAFETARTFGEFTKLLVDIPGERLVEVIPNFHNTRWRYENFQKALATDKLNRASEVKAEIAFLQKRETDCSIVVEAMARGEVPERITHNDTKLNNILIDDYTRQGLCVIDLDTAMPGSVLYDFGDMVRSATVPVAEDETDLSKVVCRLEYFEALAQGYLTALGSTLTETERQLLPFSGKLLTLEVGMRFLTDYLEGDTYFKTAHPKHNLERCRNQFALVSSIESQLDKMDKLLAENKNCDLY